MHVDKVLCHGENGGAKWETSHRGCIMRKVVSKEGAAEGRLDFYQDSVLKNLRHIPRELMFYKSANYG